MRGFTLISYLRQQPPVFWVNLALKVVLVGLLVVGAFSGLQQFEGKGYSWRLATYPIAAVVVPVAWTILGRRPAYPYATDLLLTLPLLVDTAGNALDLYDSIVWWDDANHFVNWTLLSGAVGALAWRNRIGRWQTMAFVVGSAGSPLSCGRLASTSRSFVPRPSLTRPTPTRWAIWRSA